MKELTHASFFSGVGGLDRGLEQAGWETVSFSEIDPYASAVLARHWPSVENLGDITRLRDLPPQIGGATLWSGGFPCQDLSVAGKRRGMGLGHGDTEKEETRSGLAFAFLDLLAGELAAGRGPEFVLLENVPGLLSSHAGRDFGALLGALAELGFGVAYRIIDARFVGVPQRRRRVFILGVRSRGDDPDGHLAALRAAEVLSVGTGCLRHPVKGVKKGSKAAGGPGGGASPTLRVGPGRTEDGGPGDTVPVILHPSPDSRGVREIDGLGGRLDHRPGLEVSLTGGGLDSPVSQRIHSAEGISPTLAVQNRWGGPQPPAVFTKVSRPHAKDGEGERWAGEQEVAPTLNSFDMTDTHAVTLVKGTFYDGLNQKLDDSGIHRSIRIGRDSSDFVVADTLNSGGNSGGFRTEPGAHLTDMGSPGDEDDLLPVGLDSNRYRCCGNGVVSPVAEWIGRRLVEEVG